MISNTLPEGVREATTGDFHGNDYSFGQFPTTSVEGKSTLSRIYQGLLLAFEARAIYRVQQEAGHLLTPKQLEAMQQDYLKRRARFDA